MSPIFLMFTSQHKLKLSALNSALRPLPRPHIRASDKALNAQDSYLSQFIDWL